MPLVGKDARYDIGFDDAAASFIGLMLVKDKNKAPRYQEVDDVAVAQQYFTGQLQYANLDSKKELQVGQDDWRSGFGQLYWDSNQKKKYYTSKNIDARFKNMIIAGPLTATVSLPTEIDSGIDTNEDLDDTETDVTCDADATTAIPVGSIIIVESEKMLVSATGVILTVTRGYLGTTVTTHATNKDIRVWAPLTKLPTISNCGFEAGTLPWLGSIVQSSTQKRTGAYSGKIVCGAGAVETGYQIALNWDNSYRGQSFTFKMWVRSTSGLEAGGHAHIRIEDGIGQTDSDASFSATFTELTVTRTLDAAATHLYIYCVVDATAAAGDTYYFDDAKKQTPTGSGFPSARCEYNGKSYLAHGTILSVADSTDSTYTAVKTDFPAPIVALEKFTDDKLYIALGNGNFYYYMDIAETFTQTDSIADFFKRNGNTMIKIIKPHGYYTATDPTSDAGWTSPAIKVGASCDDVTALEVIEGTPYVMKEDMPYYLDASNDPFELIPALYAERSSTSGKNAMAWQGKLYIPSGIQSLYEYDPANTTTTDISPSKYITDSADFDGQVMALAADAQWLFAFIDNGTKLEVLAGRRETIDSVTEWVWHPISELTLTGASIAFVSTIYTPKLWVGSTSESDSLWTISLPALYGNPTVGSTFTSGGDIITPWLHCDLRGDEKAFIKITLTMSGTTANIYWTVYYQTFEDAVDDWTFVEDFKTSPITEKYIPVDASSNNPESTMTRFKFIATTNSAIVTPVLYNYDVRAVWYPPLKTAILAQVKVADGLILKDGRADETQSAATIRTALNAWKNPVVAWPRSFYPPYWASATDTIYAKLQSADCVPFKNEETNEIEWIYNLVLLVVTTQSAAAASTAPSQYQITRTENLVVASSDASAACKSQAEYTCDGVDDDVQIQAAIDAVLATGQRGRVCLVGNDFATTSEITARSNVDVDGGNTTITLTTDTTGKATVLWHNLTNSIWENLNLIRLGAPTIYGYVGHVSGTTDDTVELRNITFTNNTSTGVASGQALWFEGTAYPTVRDCRMIGGTGGHVQATGIYYSSHPILIDCYSQSRGTNVSYGNNSGYDIDNYNWDGTERTPPTLINCIGESATDADGAGFTVGYTARPILTGCVGIGGQCTDTDRACNAFNLLNQSSPTLLNCRGYCRGVAGNGLYIGSVATPMVIGGSFSGSPYRSGGSAHIALLGASAPHLVGVNAHPEIVGYKWDYDDANNGRFRPGIGASYPYMLLELQVYVNVANAAVTLNIGTSASGSQVASGIDIGTASVYLTPTIVRVEVAAAGYLYATPSSAIADDDIEILYQVITNYANSEGLWTTSTGKWNADQCSFRSNGASDAVIIQDCATHVGEMHHCTLETYDTTNQYAIKSNVALTDVPLFGCILHGGTSGISNFKGSGNTGDVLVHGETRIFQKTINYDDTSPVTIVSAADGYAITDVWAEVTTTFDDAGAALNIGDASDADGFLPAASITLSSTGYYGVNEDTRGAYLWDSANGHAITKVYTASGTIRCAITKTDGTQGIAIIYVKASKIGG